MPTVAPPTPVLRPHRPQRDRGPPDRYKPADFAIFSQQPTLNTPNTHDKVIKTEFVAALAMHQSFSLLPSDIRMGILQAILNQ